MSQDNRKKKHKRSSVYVYVIICFFNVYESAELVAACLAP
jgi:hypothetical protein